MTNATATKPDVYRDFTVPMPRAVCGDPVGALEIAGRLDIQDRSIHMIRRRGQLPRPDYDNVNGSRAWEWATILWWAGETGRLRTDLLVAAYRKMFAVAPPDLTGGRSVGGTRQLVDDDDRPKVPSRV